MTDREILKILSNFYNIEFNGIRLLREGGSMTYCILSKNDKYILKLIPLPFRNTVKQSLSILEYLNAKDFPSPKVIRTNIGLLYFELDESEESKLGVLYNYIEGEEHIKGENFEIIGLLVGRLHKLMKDYKGNLKVQDKEFFIDRYIDLLREKNYDNRKIEKFHDYGKELWNKVKDLPRGYCHCDLHTCNLLKTSHEGYHILDFDTSCNAFPMYDIMIMCNATDYFEFDDDGFIRSKNTYETFLKGYLRYCRLSDEELVSFYDLIAIYHYQLQATIIEIHGLDCVDDKFLDNQLDWLMKWRQQCEKNLN